MHRRMLMRSLGLTLGTMLCLSRPAAAGTPPGLVAYAEQDFEYVRFDLFSGAPVDIGPLTQYMSVGTFANNDFSQEYAIDYPNNDLYSIDVDTADATLIGATGLNGVVSGLIWDSTNSIAYLMAHDAACDATSLYTIDLTSGATQAVGAAGGCLAGLAIDAAGEMYSIDTALDDLVELDVGVIGPLGFDFTSISALFFDPSTGILYLIAVDRGGTGLNGVYTVDPLSGAATLIGDFGSDPVSAFAVAPADADTLFSNGFDPASAVR